MLLYNLDEFFNTEMINLEGGANKVDSGKANGSEAATSSDEFEKSVTTLDRKIEELNWDIFSRCFNDHLFITRMREDIDTMSN
jgi:uncharacterized sporulation protein YeaH/YhbH (DUF444 family)